MSFDDVLYRLKSIYESRHKSLTPLEEKILEAAWNQESYGSIAQALYLTEGHVRDVAADLWQQLSSMLGTKLTKRTFRGLIEQRLHQFSELVVESASDKPHSVSQSYDHCTTDTLSCQSETTAVIGEVPTGFKFYGRTSELAKLQSWVLQERCRLISVEGMGGIGKTSMAAMLAQRIAPKFKMVIWRSLLNAPELPVIVKQLLGHLGLPQAGELDLESQLLTLIKCLKQYRCLIVLDNIETVLTGYTKTPYREGYENYDHFFRYLGETEHQSCLIITSREKPPAVLRLGGKNRPVRSYFLTGLPSTTAQQLLESSQDLQASTSDWQELASLYQGHPLALELVAQHIEDVFFGDVGAFLNQGKPVFSDITPLLDWHCQRLSEAELEILYWLVCHRCSVSLQELGARILSPDAQKQLPSTLQVLQRNLPLIRNQKSFALQPVLLEYFTDRFTVDMGQALLATDLQKIDQFCWLQTTIPDYRRQSQLRLLVEPILRYCQTQLASEQTLETLILDRLKQFQDSSLTGYGAGNLVNLLVHIGSHLSQRQFSNLSLRHIYLQGQQLWNTDFGQSHFEDAVFTQSIKGVMAITSNSQTKLVAVSDSDGVIYLYSLGETQPIMSLQDHQYQSWIYGIDFNPWGDRLLSGGLDNIIRLWNCQTGELIRCWSHTSAIISVAYHPNGQQFATGCRNGDICLWDVAKEHPVRVLSGHQSLVACVCFTSDGSRLISSDDQGIIKIWDETTSKYLHRIEAHQSRVRSLAVNNGQIVSGGDDCTVKLWNLQTGEQLACLTGHQNIVRAVDFSQNGRQLVSASYDGTIRIWDRHSGECIKRLKKDTQRIDAIAVTDDYLVVGNKDQTLQVWNMATEECCQSLQGFVVGTTSLDCVMQQANSRVILASSGLDHFVWVWDLSTGQRLHQLKGHDSNVWATALSHDGQTLASGSYDGTIKLWDVATGALLHTCRGHQHFVRSVAFAPKGPLVASGSDDCTVKLWHRETGACIQTLTAHTDKVQHVQFTADGAYLVSSANDGMVLLWNGKTGAIEQRFEQAGSKIMAIAPHPQEPYLVSGNDLGEVTLWHLHTGKCLQTGQHQGLVWSIAISPDGETVASASEDKTVKLWSLKTGEEKLCLAHNTAVGAVTFSPDGQYVICGCLQENIYIYSLENSQEVRSLTIPRPYEGMNIRAATGLTPTQRATLHQLGARS